MKRLLQWILGLGISGVLLWLALRGVDLGQAVVAMRRVAWWVYPAYFLLLCAQYLLRTWRWQLQMDRLTGRHMPFWDAFSTCCVSFAAIFLLPFRLGEFVRPYLAAQLGFGRKSSSLATVAVERVLDGLVMTAFLALLLVGMGDREVPVVIAMGGWLALLVFGSAMGVFVAAYRWREPSLRFWAAVLRPFPARVSEKLLGMLRAFIDGLKSLPTVRDMAAYLAMTVAYWILNGLAMWLLAVGMGLGVPLLGGYFTLACLVVGITIPAGPGNVGNFEYAIQVSLSVFGVSQTDGAAYAIWTHLFQMLHMMAMALPFLLVGKVTYARVARATHGDLSDPPPPGESAPPATH
jgi:hypothetical protein